MSGCRLEGSFTIEYFGFLYAYGDVHSFAVLNETTDLDADGVVAALSVWEVAYWDHYVTR